MNIVRIVRCSFIVPLFVLIVLAGLHAPKNALAAGANKGIHKSGKPGVQLWTENCARCHNLRPPASQSDREWSVISHHMRVRANLTKEEYEKILEFLKSAN